MNGDKREVFLGTPLCPFCMHIVRKVSYKKTKQKDWKIKTRTIHAGWYCEMCNILFTTDMRKCPI